MTFSAPRVPPVLETQKVMVNDIEETPVACVQLGDNMNEPPGGDPGVVRTIGTVTVAGNASPVVGDTVTYTATASGNATEIVYTFAAPGETFTGGTVTWANDGATTVTVTATSATANDSGATGTLAVTVTANIVPLAMTLTSGDFADGNAMPDSYGQGYVAFDAEESPELNWTITGTNAADVVNFQLVCTDITAGGVEHWRLGGTGNGQTEEFFTNTSIASVTGANAGNNNITPNGAVGNTDGQTFANGWWPPFPPAGTSPHTYQFVLTGFDAAGQQLVQATLSGTFSANPGGPATAAEDAGTFTTSPDGNYTAEATTSQQRLNGDPGGTGMTISYTITGGAISNITVVDGGNNYIIGDTVTVDSEQPAGGVIVMVAAV